MNVLLIGLPGGPELIIILAVVLLLFGGRKIPELMRGIGKGMREFNTAKNSLKEEVEKGMKETDDSDKNSNEKKSTEKNSTSEKTEDKAEK